ADTQRGWVWSDGAAIQCRGAEPARRIQIGIEWEVADAEVVRERQTAVAAHRGVLVEQQVARCIGETAARVPPRDDEMSELVDRARWVNLQ
ncbi:hypothetical protein, partial [Salmonella sp. SAL4443]|uniref:hypothetical protein n=1 Tax=Salmonella sp. SAL4443 TaxID=3159898 RepID=UPI003978B6C5